MTTKTGIIFLLKDKFQIYSPFLPTILEFRFVPELIRDFDLINKELFENLIKVFIVNNKIPASGLLIVIGDNASFIKDFVTPPANQNLQQTVSSQPTLEDLQSMANQYLEHVPFEIITAKTFPLASGVRAYATNQEIYEALKAILEKHGFIIQGVLPGFAFGPEIGNKAMLDGVTIGIILQKLSMVRGYNLLKDSGEIVEAPVESSIGKEEEPEQEPEHSSGKDNKKMILAVAISAIVLIFVITGIVLYSQFTNPPYKPPSAEQHPAAASAVASVSPTIPPSVQSTTILEAKDLTVQIINASTSAAKAETVRTAFTPFGFKSVTLQTQGTLNAAQGILIFSSRVSETTKISVTASIKQILGEVLIQDKPDASFDIVVILGK